MQSLLITGTDTDVGKTWISCQILKQLRRQGHPVGAYKPVCSGVVETSQGQPSWHDVDALRSACGDSVPFEQVCPQTFNAAVAPNIAAEMEGRTVDDDLLFSGFAAWQNSVDYMVIEGAGGLLCPLSNKTNVADLAHSIAATIVIVAANRLGMINHTLLTVEVAERRGLNVAAVVVNNATAGDDDQSCASNCRQLQHWLPGTQILTCEFEAEDIVDISSQPYRVAQLFGNAI